MAAASSVSTLRRPFWATDSTARRKIGMAAAASSQVAREDVGGDRGRRQAEVRPCRAVLGLVRGGVFGREARQRKPVDQPDDNVGIQTGGVEADDDALAGGIAPDVVDARVRPQESLQRFALPFEHGRRIHTKPGSTGHGVDEAGANDGWFAGFVGARRWAGARRTGVRHAPCRFDRRVTCPRSRLRIAQPQTSLAAPARAHQVVIRSIPPLTAGKPISPCKRESQGVARRRFAIALRPNRSYTRPLSVGATSPM